MKKCVLIPAIVLMCAVSLEAAQPGKGIAVEFKQLTVTFYGEQKQPDVKSYTLVEAALASGSKERFGLGSTNAGEKVLEILDTRGKVVRSLTISDVFGGKGSALPLAGRWDATSRRTEKILPVDLPNGKAQIIMRALATGEGKAGSAGQHLVVTCGLKADAPMTLALRMSISAVGDVTSGDHGFVVTSKSGSGAISVAVAPEAAFVETEKARVILTSPVIALDGTSEAPAFWMIFDGETGSAVAGAKVLALQSLKEKHAGAKEPQVAVVSTTDMQNTQPGDTVTYMLVCTNTGGASATDVALSNPIPDGMEYVEGSATSDGSQVNMDRSPAGVKKISWTFVKPVEPGGERVVSFKVRVR